MTRTPHQSMAVSVLLVDDHSVIAEPLKMALGAHGFDRVSSVSDDLRPETVLATAHEVEATSCYSTCTSVSTSSASR